jgi:hypothetical protein
MIFRAFRRNGGRDQLLLRVNSIGLPYGGQAPIDITPK